MITKTISESTFTGGNGPYLKQGYSLWKYHGGPCSSFFPSKWPWRSTVLFTECWPFFSPKSQILGTWSGRLDATSPQSKRLAYFVESATKETSWNRSCLPAVVLDQWVNWWLSRQSDKFPSGRSCPPQLPGEVVVLLPVRHMWALQVRLVQFMFNLGHCSSRQPLTVTRRYRPVLQWLCQGENSGDDKRNLVRFLVRIILSRKMSHV